LFESRTDAAGFVIGAVDERMIDPESMPRSPAPDIPADELERHHVQMSLEEPLNFLEAVGAAGNGTVDVDLDLGERGAAVGQFERERIARIGSD
jgi:hypothetical protein